MKKVLFIVNEVIGDNTAGPGIRYTEIATELSRKGYFVTILGKKTIFTNTQSFKYDSISIINLIKYLLISEIIVIRGGGPIITFIISFFSKKKKIIIDLYAFTHFEVPHLIPKGIYQKILKGVRSIFHIHKLKIYCNIFNIFWVASIRQKHFLYGALYMTNMLKKEKSIYIIPFGYPSQKPKKNNNVLRGIIKGIDSDDFILIWGGGVWDWLDPITLVKAMAEIWKINKKIKLYFMGIKAPTGYISEKAKQSLKISEKLGILNKNVFFNMGWISYKERIDYLLEADAGISLHPYSLETEFSFRTRILDYVYCELPIIHTDGDVWADIIKKEKIGITVPPEDKQSIVNAILKLYFDKDLVKEIKKRYKMQIFHLFTWKSITEKVSESFETESKNNNNIYKNFLLLCKEYIIFSIKTFLLIIKVIFGM